MNIAANFKLTWITDRALDGPLNESARQVYNTMMEAGEVPSGSDHELCLLVDESCVASMLDGEGGSGTPYVIAVDRNGVDEEEPDSLGYFKVAVSALPAQLWMDSQGTAPEEPDPQGGIYSAGEG